MSSSQSCALWCIAGCLGSPWSQLFGQQRNQFSQNVHFPQCHWSQISLRVFTEHQDLHFYESYVYILYHTPLFVLCLFLNDPREYYRLYMFKIFLPTLSLIFHESFAFHPSEVSNFIEVKCVSSSLCEFLIFQLLLLNMFETFFLAKRVNHTSFHHRKKIYNYIW